MNTLTKRSLCKAFLTGALVLLPAELQAVSPTKTKLTIEPARHVSALEPVVLTATVVSDGHSVSPVSRAE
jgi:hypothetical protein